MINNPNQIKTECIFCNKINNEPEDLIYSDEHSAAFLDLFPVDKAHILVVPKKHFRTWLETDVLDLSFVNIAAQKIAQALMKVDPEIKGFNIVINNEAIANQKVFHFHLHLIPKYYEYQGFISQNSMSIEAKNNLSTTKSFLKEKLKLK